MQSCMTTTSLRPRRDGWTPDRQAVFIAALTGGGSIAAAAAAAAMSRQSAYRLRRRDAAVAAAWSGPAGPPADTEAFNAVVEAAWAQRDADRTAAGAADPRGADRRLLGELRADIRRIKRRAAAARRRLVAKAGRDVGLCHLLPRLDPVSGGLMPPFTARDRGAGGRFVAKNVVAP